MLDGLDVRGSPARGHTRPQPGPDRLREHARLGEVIGEHFRYDRFAQLGVPQHFHDVGVHGPALGLDHGFVRHPLQQGVPELVADLRPDSLRHQDLRFDQRLQPLVNLRLVLEQGAQEVQRERAADAGRRLGNAPRPRPAVEALRHQFGEPERHAAESPVWHRPSGLLVEQGYDELFEKERDPFGRFDRLRDRLVGQRTGPGNRPRKLEAIRQPQGLETDRLVDLRKGQALGKGPHGQHREDGQLGRGGDHVPQQLRR